MTSNNDARADVPRFWKYFLPLLVALNAFSLGVQFARQRELTAMIKYEATALEEIAANAERLRKMLGEAEQLPHCEGQRLDRPAVDPIHRL